MNDNIIDEFTDTHLVRWLMSAYDNNVERGRMYFKIRQIIKEDSSVLERCSWPELRDMAERNESLGIGF